MQKQTLFALFFIFWAVGTEAQEEFKTYIDLHCQPSLKPFNSRSSNINYNLWSQIDHSCSNERSIDVMTAANNTPKFSQAHFEALIKGNVRIIGLTVSPIEFQFLNSSTFLVDRNRRATVACLHGIYANELFSRRSEIDYFQDVVEHVEYLKMNENKPYYFNGEEYSYLIVRKSADIDTVLNNPNKIGLVLNIEGGHALGHSIYMTGKDLNPKEQQVLMLENVKRLKSQLPMRSFSDVYLDIPFLYAGLCKTYPNGLGGTSLSMSRSLQTIFTRPVDIGVSRTPIGESLIEELITGAENSPPILIDIKHMSLAFREAFYSDLERVSLLGANLPVVASHVGISGMPWKSNLYKKKDEETKNGNEFLNHWQQNLGEEDLKRIAASKGIIGITLDKTVLGGDLALRRIAETLPNTQQRRDACIELFLANVLKAVQIMSADIRQDTAKQSAWNYIALGSDFDGMREPLDVYTTAQDMPALHNDIQRFFENPRPIAPAATGLDEKVIKSLMFGLSSSEIADRIMWKNALGFLRTRINTQPFPERAKSN